MKILSSFTHPQVDPNLYECVCSEHKGRYSEECVKQSSSGAPKQPGYKLSSEYLPLCSAEQTHSYRFGSTWGWVNDDRIFIFGCTVPLRSLILFVSPAQVCLIGIAAKLCRTGLDTRPISNSTDWVALVHSHAVSIVSDKW